VTDLRAFHVYTEISAICTHVSNPNAEDEKRQTV